MLPVNMNVIYNAVGYANGFLFFSPDHFVFANLLAAPIVIDIHRVVATVHAIGNVGDEWRRKSLNDLGFSLLFQYI
jgi:hypothetical protein